MNEYTEAVRLMGNVNAADGTRYVLMGGDQERSVPAANKVWGYVNQVLDGYGLNYNTAKSVDGLISRYAIGDGTLLEKAPSSSSPSLLLRLHQEVFTWIRSLRTPVSTRLRANEAVPTMTTTLHPGRCPMNMV